MLSVAEIPAYSDKWTTAEAKSAEILAVTVAVAEYMS